MFGYSETTLNLPELTNSIEEFLHTDEPDFCDGTVQSVPKPGGMDLLLFLLKIGFADNSDVELIAALAEQSSCRLASPETPDQLPYRPAPLFGVLACPLCTKWHHRAAAVTAEKPAIDALP